MPKSLKLLLDLSQREHGKEFGTQVWNEGWCLLSAVQVGQTLLSYRY